MSNKRRVKELFKKTNIQDDNKPLLMFDQVDDLYYIKLDGEEFELSENELEDFKKDYGSKYVVSIIDNIPKGNDYIPLDK